MHDLAPRHNSKRTRKCPECNETPILKRQRNSPEMSSKENDWNMIQKDIGNQLPYLKEEIWKQVCEAWYSVAPNVL